MTNEYAELARTLGDECIASLNSFTVGSGRSESFAEAALELLPPEERGPFAIDLFGKVEEWEKERCASQAPVKLILWKAVARDFMYAESLDCVERAAAILLNANPSSSKDAERFEEMFKRMLAGYSKQDTTWRLMRLISLAGDRRTPAFWITVYALIKKRPDLIVTLASKHWESYR